MTSWPEVQRWQGEGQSDNWVGELLFGNISMRFSVEGNVAAFARNHETGTNTSIPGIKDQIHHYRSQKTV